MNIAIRVDGSATIGSGHVMRCLTLADELAANGAVVTFLSAAYVGNLLSLVEGRGYEALAVDVTETGWTQEADLSATRSILGDRRFDWLMVDRYGIDRRWEEGMRPNAGRIGVIDDLADRPHDADLLVDTNYYDDYGTRYDTLVSPPCLRLLGPRYAFVGPTYRELSRRPKAPGDVERILVFFGGGDPTGETAKIVESLPAVTDYRYDVVVGAANPERGRIEAAASERSNVTLHVGLASLADLMGRCDLAIGAGGVTTWERFRAGLPAITVSVADNQIRHLADLADIGALIYLGDATTIDAAHWENVLAFVAGNVPLRSAMTARGYALVDGLGAPRVARAILADRLTVRPATIDDAALMHQWRNDPAIRSLSFDSREIPLEAHVAWVTKTLADETRPMLIGLVDDEPVGVVRYDIGGDAATISIYLDPARFGQGLGRRLVVAADEWLVSHRPGVSRIKAEIIPHNRASLALFETAGYAEDRRIFVRERAPVSEERA